MNFIIDNNDEVKLNKRNTKSLVDKINDKIILAGTNIMLAIKKLLFISKFKDVRKDLICLDNDNVPCYIIFDVDIALSFNIDSLVTMNKWTSISYSKLSSINSIDDLDIIINDDTAKYLENNLNQSIENINIKYKLGTPKRIYISPDLGMQLILFKNDNGNVSLAFSFTGLQKYIDCISDDTKYDNELFKKLTKYCKSNNINPEYLMLCSYDNVPYYITYSLSTNTKNYIYSYIYEKISISGKFKCINDEKEDYLLKYTILPFNCKIDILFTSLDKTLYCVLYHTNTQKGIMILPKCNN